MSDPAPPRCDCIFCGQRFAYAQADYRAPGGILAARKPIGDCPDPRTRWGHVEFWGSTREQRDARFGPDNPKPTPEEIAEGHAQAKAALDARFKKLAQSPGEAQPPGANAVATSPPPGKQIGFGL